jgi:hypothetical protein
VAADACAGASDVDHQRALDALALYAPLVTITSVAQVLAELEAQHKAGLKAAPAERAGIAPSA